MMSRETTRLGHQASEQPKQPTKLNISSLTEKAEPFDGHKDISGNSTRKSNTITFHKPHMSFNCSEEEKTPGK